MKINKIILVFIALATTIGALTLWKLNPDTMTLTIGITAIAIINILIYVYSDEIQYKIAQENEYKEWRTGKKILDQEAIQQLKHRLPEKLQSRIGELQADRNQLQQKNQELKKRLKQSTEVKTKKTAQQKHSNQKQEFKQQASRYRLPEEKTYKLIQSTPPYNYIGQLLNIWKKEHKVMIEYRNQDGKQYSEPKQENQILPRKFEQQVQNADTLLIHINKNGEHQPPAYIQTQG